MVAFPWCWRLLEHAIFKPWGVGSPEGNITDHHGACSKGRLRMVAVGCKFSNLPTLHDYPCPWHRNRRSARQPVFFIFFRCAATWSQGFTVHSIPTSTLRYRTRCLELWRVCHFSTPCPYPDVVKTRLCTAPSPHTGFDFANHYKPLRTSPYKYSFSASPGVFPVTLM